MVVPRVKQSKLYDNSFKLSENLTYITDNYKEKISELFKYLIPGVKAIYDKNAVIEISYNERLKKEEYILNVTEEKIKIEYSDYLGIRNAVSTVSNIITSDFSVPLCEIHDYPECDYRGFMVDMGRGVEDLHKFKNDLIISAKAKMNILHYHFYDSQGSGIKLKSLPESLCFSDAYTIEETKELIAFCDVLGLEIIPEFDIPAHAVKLLEAMPNLKCDTDLENQTNWTACAGNEELFEFYNNVISEISEIFPGKYLHVGGDEIEFADKPELNRLCHWNDCKKCRRYMEKNNIKDRQELWYNVLLKVYDIVKSNGKTMVMWSDQIDCNREIPVPRDVVMQFWRVAGEGRGPHLNCSMNAQLKAGFKVINSHFPDTYVDLEQYVNSEKLKDWFWDKSPESDEEVKENILGTEVCAWEYGNHERYKHYSYSLPSALVLMGDKMWNKDSLPYSDEYERLVTRTVLGKDVPENFNVYKAFGDVIPPRSDEKIYKDKIKCTAEEIDDILNTLKSIDNNLIAAAFYNCIKDGLKETDFNVVESLE